MPLFDGALIVEGMRIIFYEEVALVQEAFCSAFIDIISRKRKPHCDGQWLLYPIQYIYQSCLEQDLIIILLWRGIGDTARVDTSTSCQVSDNIPVYRLF